ncbi:hypothetical protein Scep_009322 [Stephania cephalantha]|uniref:Uncharacterized protein n=1 Tax=Stephania cephalantha TaxID=152367 RepID=A0AAP0JSX2_9MAGN
MCKLFPLQEKVADLGVESIDTRDGSGCVEEELDFGALKELWVVDFWATNCFALCFYVPLMVVTSSFWAFWVLISCIITLPCDCFYFFCVQFVVPCLSGFPMLWSSMAFFASNLI